MNSELAWPCCDYSDPLLQPASTSSARAVELGSVDAFLRLTGVSDVQPQPRLALTAANLPPTTRVVVLALQARPT